MGSIGPAEILVVLVVALIVLGPNRLPDAARSVGKAVSELRRMTTGFQSEVKDAFAEKAPTYPSTPTSQASTPPAGVASPPTLSKPSRPALPARPEDAELPGGPADGPAGGPTAESPPADRPVA